MTVKLPTGLREAELARHVVEVRHFLTGQLEYEIYTFGEQTMVVPVGRARKTAIETKLVREIERLIPEARVEVSGDIVYVTVPRDAAKVAMRRAKKLKKLERKLGVSIRFRIE